MKEELLAMCYNVNVESVKKYANKIEIEWGDILEQFKTNIADKKMGTSPPEHPGLCYCGHDCSRCVTYLATIYQDERLRQQAKDFYQTSMGREIPLDQIHCLGGRSDDIFFLCADCPWMQCCKEQGISSCSECSKYPCKPLADYEKKYVNKCNQFQQQDT